MPNLAGGIGGGSSGGRSGSSQQSSFYTPPSVFKPAPSLPQSRPSPYNPPSLGTYHPVNPFVPGGGGGGTSPPSLPKSYPIPTPTSTSPTSLGGITPGNEAQVRALQERARFNAQAAQQAQQAGINLQQYYSLLKARGGDVPNQSALSQYKKALDIQQAYYEKKIPGILDRVASGQVKSATLPNGQVVTKENVASLRESYASPVESTTQQTSISIQRVSTGEYKGVPTYKYVTTENGVQRPSNAEEINYYQSQPNADNILRAVTKEQQEAGKIQFKRDVLGKSGLYQVIPYIGQQVASLTEKIPGVKAFERKFNLDLPVGSVENKPLNILLRIGEQLASQAPLAIFEPLLKTGIQDVKFKQYQREPITTYKEVQVPFVTKEGELKVYSTYQIKQIRGFIILK